MADRRTPRASTPRLLGWALVMFILGLGLGSLLTLRSCTSKTHRLPGDEESVPPPSAPRRARPRESEPPGQAPGQAPEEAPEPSPVPKPVPLKPPPSEVPGPALPSPKGRLALVIDDLGYASPELVSRLCKLAVPFSVAVLPYQEFTRASADIAHDCGKEVLLHLPMEPLGYPGPGKNPGPQAVLFHLSESETRDRVRKALADIPHRTGVNNHMGSRITPDRTRMTWILQEIKSRHCFFVDSRTEKDSVAYAVAQELSVPSVQRKVFLDDDKRFPAVAKQWDRALALARKDGQVLIIGHIYPETVEALEILIPAAKGRVTFVKAGALAQ
jgi:uncharacterized protein